MLVMGLAACSNSGKAPLRQLPVQLGRAAPPTPTPFPTATLVPPPACATPAVDVLQWVEEKGPSPDAHVMVGQVKSNCTVEVDVTLAVQWLDGPERTDGPRAFATLRRVQPGETRSFNEVAAGGKGSSRAELSAVAGNAALVRRR